LRERREAWSDYLVERPDCVFREQLEQEIQALVQLEGKMEVAQAMSQSAKKQAKIRAVHDPIDHVKEGSPVAPVVMLDSEVPISTVRLNYHKAGTQFYRSERMEPAGEGFFRGTIPASDVQAGMLEYYLEGEVPDRGAVPLSGSASLPHSLTVEGVSGTRSDIAGRSSASFSVEWEDFFMRSPGLDYYTKAEGDFAYRLAWQAFYSFRMGFGIFEGVGGPADRIEAEGENDGIATPPLQPEELTLAYSYFEPEITLSELVHLVPRLVVGTVRRSKALDDSAVERGSGIVGFHTYLRFGQERGTNLLVGGSLTDEMGTEGLIAMNLDVFEYIPVRATVASTNLAVGEGYAARLGFRVGWRRVDWMSVDLIAGVNMRNIRHIGTGGGLGVSFNW